MDDLDGVPIENHIHYRVLRGDEEDVWKKCLQAMQNGKKSDLLSFDFLNGRGWDHLTCKQVMEMISHFPPSIQSLRI